jgi:serine-threonine kinase receptor-associated protein
MEKVIRNVDVEKNEVVSTFEGHCDSVNCLVAIKNTDLIWSASGGSKENAIRLWDIRSGKESIKAIETPGEVSSMELSQDGKWMTVASATEIQIWDVEKNSIIKTFPVEKGRTFKCASLDPSKRFLLTGSKEELWARLISVETGSEIDLFKGHHGHVRAAAFSPLSDSFATASEDGTIRIWKYRLPE